MAEREPTDGEEGAGSRAEPSDAEIDAALEALTDPERLRRAEARVAEMAPQLQHILVRALGEGWFDEAHRAEVLKAATIDDPEERVTALRTLLAEETRLGMFVGVAVGWELARELDREAGGRATDASPRRED